MTNDNYRSASSPPLPPLPTSAYSSPSPPPLILPSSASPSPSPKTSFSSRFKSKPQAIAIFNNTNNYGNSLEPAQPSPRRGSIAAHLMNFATRSTTSLQLLSSSAPAHNGSSLGPSPSSTSLVAQEEEMRSQVLPLRSTPFSNPFKKLQHTFHNGGAAKKNSSDGQQHQQQQKIPERIVSSSASAQSMTSWRSKGAEMLSKKTWGRTRKNSEPTYAGQGVLTSPIFGSSIDDAVRVSHIPGTPMVPAVLYRCAEFLEAKGVDEVGLYRVPGSHASVQKLKRLFDSGKDYNLLTMDGIDPNDIATLLKLYLRELPTPLLPAVFLEQFQSLISMDRQICHSLRGILIRLSRSNYILLSFLCHHLSRIAGHSDKTKMNVSNLGVVFAPTLSIGSVLFRALLGGFYNTEDTAENREKGLKLVWGGLLQDFEYGSDQTWAETAGGGGEASHMPLPLLYQTGPMSPEHPLSPAQEIAMAASQSLTVPSTSTGLGFTQSLPSDHQFPTSASSSLSREDDEANLLAAMVLREERAAAAGALAAAEAEHDDDTCSNVSSGSLPSVDCTDNTALSAMSSPVMMMSKEQQQQQAFETSFTSPSMAFSSPTMTSSAPFSPLLSTSSHLISTASVPTDTTTTNSLASDNNHLNKNLPSIVAIPNLNQDLTTKVVVEDKEEVEDEDEDEDDVQVPKFEHTSATGAPQLPPLEGLMIAL